MAKEILINYQGEEAQFSHKKIDRSKLYWVSDIDGIEVPTSNTTSVSGSDGEISNYDCTSTNNGG